MKLKLILPIFALLAAMWSCDKVENAYPADPNADLDESLYPGDWSAYVFPTFSDNPNTQRNVLIEDFTGHKCVYCPAAADAAHDIQKADPSRVFISTIHTGPSGKENFQSTSEPSSTSADFSYDFTNLISVTIGQYFGELAGSGFSGNPSGTVSRKSYSGKICMSFNDWQNAVNAVFNENDLKVNLQSELNYYEETKGVFLHLEVDLKDLTIDPTNIGLVVALYQDSIVKPQLYPAGTPDTYKGADTNYVHRDLLKAYINGGFLGKTLEESKKAENGKYYYDYSIQLETDFPYDKDNCHFLIYAVDKTTAEIYQVIKQKIE
jgi:hypothetical protein